MSHIYIYTHTHTPFHKLFDLLHGLMTNNNYVFFVKRLIII